MAYAFDKVDDYFRRSKEGQRGSLQRGTTGAPPPTAAAEAVAKQAETSAELGNADTSAYKANRMASQAAAQSALTQPAQRQAQAWEQGETAKAGEFKAEGEKRIGETYKPWTPESLSGIESGNQEAMQRGREQVGYTGKELTFQPYQASAPQIDTSSMLRGGVGGLQAALQKGKGGRYTAGMGALDASLMAGNRGAMQGLQTKMGDIYQGAREKKASLEQTDEQLAQKALETGTGTASAVRKALEDRFGAISNETIAALQQRGQQATEQSRAALMPSFGMFGASNPVEDAIRNQLRTYGLSETQINERMRGASGRIDPNAFIAKMGTSELVETPQNYANIASVLGRDPGAFRQSYETYGIDPNAIAAEANRIMSAQYAGITDNFRPAQQSTSVGMEWDRNGDGSIDAQEEAAAIDAGYDTYSDTVSMEDARSGYEGTTAPGSYRDYGTVDTSDYGDTMSGGSWDYSPGDDGDGGDSGW
jgi:hypothetical protein